MKKVSAEIYLISTPVIDWNELETYFESVGTEEFELTADNDQQDLVEVAGRVCYRSWEPKLNANVTKIRKGQEAYIENILRSGHGSVLQHVNFGFMFRNVSRVLTHELVRHGAGTAVSQESSRYVRLDSDVLSMWLPEWMSHDRDFMEHAETFLDCWAGFYQYAVEYYALDSPETDFHRKKEVTSALRRFAPEGRATELMWTANVRALRHIIELRTAPGAEEEIREFFGRVCRLMQRRSPLLFEDFELQPDGKTWKPRYSKV
jgi:thymidylate synthase (FAD)